MIEAKDGGDSKGGDKDGKGDSKEKDKADKKPAKMVKAKALKHEVKDGQWPPSQGASLDYMLDDANHEFLKKWQPFADKASQAIGPKSQNKFAAKDLCTAEFPCVTVTNASTAKMEKDVTGATKPEPIPMKKMDKFLKHLSTKKTIKLGHAIHKEMLYGGEVHHGGVVARLTAFKKQEADVKQAVGMLFDAWKMVAFSKKPQAVRAVLAKTDDKPIVLQSVCLFPKGSNKAQADNFCRGRDMKEDPDDDAEEGGKDGGKGGGKDGDSGEDKGGAKEKGEKKTSSAKGDDKSASEKGGDKPASDKGESKSKAEETECKSTQSKEKKDKGDGPKSDEKKDGGESSSKKSEDKSTGEGGEKKKEKSKADKPDSEPVSNLDHIAESKNKLEREGAHKDKQNGGHEKKAGSKEGDGQDGKKKEDNKSTSKPEKDSSSDHNEKTSAGSNSSKSKLTDSDRSKNGTEDAAEKSETKGTKPGKSSSLDDKDKKPASEEDQERDDSKDASDDSQEGEATVEDKHGSKSKQKSHGDESSKKVSAADEHKKKEPGNGHESKAKDTAEPQDGKSSSGMDEAVQNEILLQQSVVDAESKETSGDMLAEMDDGNDVSDSDGQDDSPDLGGGDPVLGKRDIEYSSDDFFPHLAARGIDVGFGAMQDAQPALKARDALQARAARSKAVHARQAALRKQPTLRKRQDPAAPQFSAFGNSVQDHSKPSVPQVFDDGMLAAAGNAPAFDGPGKDDFSGAGAGGGVDTGGDPNMDMPGGADAGDGAMRRRSVNEAVTALIQRRRAAKAAQLVKSE